MLNDADVVEWPAMSEEDLTVDQVEDARRLAERYGRDVQEVISRVTEAGSPFDTALEDVERELESELSHVGRVWVESSTEEERREFIESKARQRAEEALRANGGDVVKADREISKQLDRGKKAGDSLPWWKRPVAQRARKLLAEEHMN